MSGLQNATRLVIDWSLPLSKSFNGRLSAVKKSMGIQIRDNDPQSDPRQQRFTLFPLYRPRAALREQTLYNRFDRRLIDSHNDRLRLWQR
jgi:hypothetical protein